MFSSFTRQDIKKGKRNCEKRGENSLQKFKGGARDAVVKKKKRGQEIQGKLKVRW